MSEDASIRRENLNRLKIGARDLSERVGGRYTYWRDLLTDPNKSFGEKAARKIEEKLQLPRGSLDLPAESMTSDPADPAWPLPNISRARLSGLTPTQRALLEGYMLGFLLRLEAGGKDDAPLLIIPAPESPPISKEGIRNGKVTAIREDEAAPGKSGVGKSSGKSFATSKKR
jgi:hypothetical protein